MTSYYLNCKLNVAVKCLPKYTAYTKSKQIQMNLEFNWRKLIASKAVE